MNSFFGCLTLLILHGIKSTKTEIFTSIAEVEELFESESVLINHFEGYFLVQERKIDYLNLKLQEYKGKQVTKANVTLHVSNPINTYLLMKRLISDWKYVEDLMFNYYRSFLEFLENGFNYRIILKFPSKEDLDGAVEALIRLQDTYNLETASVAKGELNGVQYSIKMAASDCLELGSYLFDTGDYSKGILWTTEAMNHFLSKRRFIKENVTSNVKVDHNSLDVEVLNYSQPGEMTENFAVFEDRIYKMMCRNELKPTPTQLRPLRCHYVTNNVPFLKVAPLKRETASISPFIVIYHDVMYDNEIELIKKMAKPRLMRASVGNDDSEPQIGSFRVAKTAWIFPTEDKTIQNIVQRTEDMTGLNMKAAEDLQVVNYGIGGHYEPHFDFSKKDEYQWEDYSSDSRIATVLFYMSDVEQGGATVFPAIHTTIFPKKGTAVFWYNLYASGEGDYRTRHAACPVLTGSKWASTIWIHERGQEFRRQCDLVPDNTNIEKNEHKAIISKILESVFGK